MKGSFPAICYKSCLSAHDNIADDGRCGKTAQMTRWIEANVSTLRCEAEGHLTPYVTFIGDNDMVTADLGSLSSIISAEVVLAERKTGETFNQRSDMFESRINKLLERNDLRFVRLRRIEQEDIPDGLSFQEYKKAYSPPRRVFVCPRCGADCFAIKTESPEAFEQGGGTLKLIGDLTLCR